MSKIYRSKARSASFADRPRHALLLGPQQLPQPEERAIGFAYTFLGIRIQCAQCHKHPFDQWSKDDFDAFQQLLRPRRVDAERPAERPAGSGRIQEDREGPRAGESELRGNQLRQPASVELLQRRQDGSVPEIVVDARRRPTAGRR